MCNRTAHFAADNRLVQRLQSSVCPYRVPLHGPVQFAIIRCIRLVGQMFSQKLPLPLWGSSPPHNTLFLGPSPLLVPNGVSISSATFVWFPNVMLYNALSVGKKTPKLPLPGPLGFCYPVAAGLSHGHGQHQQKIGKDCTCGSGDILADRHTQTYLSQ